MDYCMSLLHIISGVPISVWAISSKIPSGEHPLSVQISESAGAIIVPQISLYLFCYNQVSKPDLGQ